MQDDKGHRSPDAKGGADEEPKAAATSSETLSDVEKTEKVPSEKSDSSGSSTPSPDGTFDSNRDGNSANDDPGPM